MDEIPESEARSLKFLRTLVTVLTAVMIVGFIVLIGFLVTRFPSFDSLELPAEITLPDGTVPVAFTKTSDWYGVVTAADEILIFANDGKLLQKIVVRSD